MKVLLRIFCWITCWFLLPLFLSLLKSLLLIFISIFTFHSYSSGVQCATVLTGSRTTAQVKLSGYAPVNSTFPLDSNKGRVSSESKHVTTHWKSEVAYLSQEKKKKVCPTVYSAVFILISLLLSCLGVGFCLVFFWWKGRFHPYTPEKKISPIKTTTTKKLSWSCLPF